MKLAGMCLLVVSVGVAQTEAAVVSWGSNSYGVVTNTPTGTGLTAIAAGYDHSHALASDGSIVSWGRDSDNEVTDAPSGTGFTAIAAGMYHGLALTSNSVPEPSALVALTGLLGMGLIGYWRRRRKAA